MRIHFIAIGGAAMHNLAMALQAKGYMVSGSDDEIFEPSLTRLEKKGLLPEEFGWFPGKLETGIDAVILGMHAREDNPELLKAQDLGLKIYSYPEFLYEQTKEKKRLVIGGSHGKTTITSMVMHVFQQTRLKFDYMVGAQIEGFDTMVSLSDEAEVAIFEGDEYLSSPIDRRPKFHLYHPHVAVINGIGWDHINVFPTFENYIEQFDIFINKIEDNGSLFYFGGDEETVKLVDKNNRTDLALQSYHVPKYEIRNGRTYLCLPENKEVGLEIFGEHNLQNMEGARLVCEAAGISAEKFYTAISSFKGSAKRLQKLFENDHKTVFTDFAHSPSKVEGTIEAVRKQYADYELIAVFELHTFSSLSKSFLHEYKGSMNAADVPIVFYNRDVVKHKKLAEITDNNVFMAFDNQEVQVYSSTDDIIARVKARLTDKKQVFVFMSSGNFGGITPDDMVRLITA